MATKWKYATIPAAQRLSMLKNGNDELYKEEIARTKDAISNRLAAGLDVSEQMKWADTVSYNHNLSKAKSMGIDEANVSKDGYAAKLFGDMTESVGDKKVSTVASPAPIKDKKYYSDYDTMTRDDVAKSVSDSYIKGINDRASLLSAQYNKYAEKLEREYEKKISDAFKAYTENEKRYSEKRLNDGYSENGGRTLTEKTKAREQVYDYVNQLRNEKNEQLQKAQDSLKSSLYDMSEGAMKAIADEYYRYNSLISDEKATEYQKLRDNASDDKWWQEFSLEKTKLETDERAREKELELQKEKEENDKLLALKELAFKESQSAADYEKWLKEFEAETEYNNTKLYADIYAKKEQNELDREKFEYEKALDSADEEVKTDGKTAESKTTESREKYGDYYKNCLAAAERMASMVKYDETKRRYVSSYSPEELLNWIKKFDLTVEEKKRICSYIGIKYVED